MGDTNGWRWRRAPGLGALGGVAVGTVEALHVVATAGLGLGPIGAAFLFFADALLSALVGALVAGLVGLVPAVRRRSQAVPLLSGAGAVASLAVGTAWAPGVALVALLWGMSLAWLPRHPLAPRAIPAALLLGAALGAVQGRPRVPNNRAPTVDRPNLLLVTVAGARHDRYGRHPIDTPGLDRLAAEGTAFDLAWSPSTDPGQAARALLAGLAPWQDDEPPSDGLAALLRARGHVPGAFVGARHLGRSASLDAGFVVFDDDAVWPKGAGHLWPARLARHALGWRPPESRRADDVVDRAIRWIDGRSGAWMAWVHLDDPEAPHQPPHPWDERYYRGTDPSDPGHRSLPASAPLHPAHGDDYAGITDAAYAEARYDGEVAWTDAQLARLLTALDDAGWAPTTLVVVVGTTGLSLDEGTRWFGRDGQVRESVQHVPWVMRLPGRVPVGHRVQAPAELLDVMPTVLDYLGVSDALPPGREGVSQRPTVRGEGMARRVARAVGTGPHAGAVGLRTPGALLRWTPEGLEAERFPDEVDGRDRWTSRRVQALLEQGTPLGLDPATVSEPDVERVLRTLRGRGEPDGVRAR